MGLWAALPAQLRRLDWARGLRAGVAVAVSMAVCRALGLPVSWSALGAFEGNIVDNGGPYRTRFVSIAMLMGPGAVGAMLASLVSAHLGWALLLTAVFAFVITYLRAAGPPFTTSSVIILVVYFVGLDHPTRSIAAAWDQAALFLGGCGCAAILSLFLWPIYPFRHARQSIGECYRVLGQSLYEVELALREPALQADDAGWRSRWFLLAHGLPNRMRQTLETARAGLGSVRALTPARTLRGRNLAVLLETADILFSRSLVLIELAERAVRESGGDDRRAAGQRLAWLAQTTQAIARALQQPHRMAEVQREMAAQMAKAPGITPATMATLQFAAEFRALDGECAQNVQTALEALAGASGQGGGDAGPQHKAEQGLRAQSLGTLERLRQNWTASSSAMRHALRSAAVCVASVVLVRALHVPYGEWMALTAVIVLQPYVAHTWRKGVQRVGGTIAGGVLAAALAVFIHSPQALIVAMCITSFFTLAWYAVDYGWYCFFLTPTFVLLTLHGQHGWGVAAIRAMDTLLGAGVALIAVRVLFTESEHLRLGAILCRAALANEAYLAATRRYWSTPPAARPDADRDLLSPARRLAGLANTESEEALERVMMEGNAGPAFAVRTEHAFAFATYSRRLTQGITTVALMHKGADAEWAGFVDELGTRLHHIAGILQGEPLPASTSRVVLPPGEEQGQGVRLRRQVEVLERSALRLGAVSQNENTRPAR